MHAVFAGALEPPFRVVRARAWRELRELTRALEPVACVLDISDSHSLASLTRLRELRKHQPTVALVVASDFRGREFDLYRLGRLSVDGVLRLEDLPGGREIRGVLEEAMAVAVANVVIGGPGRDLPAIAQDALRWAIEHAESCPQVSDLAAGLALGPRALLRELKAANVVPPRSFLLWGRLIRASHLLARSQETVESTAFRLGYATGATLRKALKRHVGCSPTTLGKRGGLWWTLEVFQRKGLRRQGDRRERWADTRTGRHRAPGKLTGRR